MAAGRCLGAFDGGQLVGSALYHDLTQWWRGRPVPMAGVAGVQVAPEYRGQGVGRAVMTALAELMTERGYPLSVLYPATMTIYRSLGWEIAGHRYEAVLPARALSWRAQAGHEGRRRNQAPRPGRRGRGARGHRPRPRERPRLRPDHLGRGHGAPLADSLRLVRRLRSLRLPGPRRLPRLPLAARPQRDLRRSAGGRLGRDHPGAMGLAASNASVADTVRVQDRPVRSALVDAARAGRGPRRPGELDAPPARRARRHRRPRLPRDRPRRTAADHR